MVCLKISGISDVLKHGGRFNSRANDLNSLYHVS